MIDFLSQDVELLKKAIKVEIKEFKNHDRVKLYFDGSTGLKQITWQLKCKVKDLKGKYLPLKEEIMSCKTRI